MTNRNNFITSQLVDEKEQKWKKNPFTIFSAFTNIILVVKAWNNTNNKNNKNANRKGFIKNFVKVRKFHNLCIALMLKNLRWWKWNCNISQISMMNFLGTTIDSHDIWMNYCVKESFLQKRKVPKLWIAVIELFHLFFLLHTLLTVCK